MRRNILCSHTTGNNSKAAITVRLHGMAAMLTLTAMMLAMSILMSSCEDNSYKKPTIMVTIEPMRYFTEQIAGDKFNVVTMVPKGGNPETYEPTARQMTSLSKSELYIKVGKIGFEQTWMKKLQTYAPHTIFINSSEGIEPVRTINGTEDPHTWMSTANAIIIARNIYRALVFVDGKDSMEFKQNLANFEKEVSTIDSKIKECMARNTSKAFLIYHPTLTYFAHDYDLTQIPIEEEGHEPSAVQIHGITQLAKKKEVRTLFVQKQFSVRNTEMINHSVKAKVVKINPLGYNWDREMVNVAKAMTE